MGIYNFDSEVNYMDEEREMENENQVINLNESQLWNIVKPNFHLYLEKNTIIF